MAATPSFPYETRLNILHKSLEVIDEKALADACEFTWYNQTLCKVNDSVVRLGVVQGEYHWHKHDEDEEFFYVVDGKLLIDIEDRKVELSPRQGFVIPKGVMHRTRAQRRTVILMKQSTWSCNALIGTGIAAAGNPRPRRKLTHTMRGAFLDRSVALEYTTRFDLSPLVRAVAAAMT